MTAASAPVPINAVHSDSNRRFVLATGLTAYPNAWMALISYNHASDSTLGGMVTPFTATAGEIPCGRYVANNNKPDYAIARKDGSFLGDSVQEIQVDIEPRIVKGVTVAGVTALTDANKPIYLTDDQAYTVTKGAGIAGTAVGFILKFETVASGICTVMEFGLNSIYQNVIEEGIIA